MQLSCVHIYSHKLTHTHTHTDIDLSSQCMMILFRAFQLNSHSNTHTHAYNLLLLCIQFYCCLISRLCSIDVMSVFLAWNHINDIDCTSHIYISGVTCDTIIGSASSGRIISIDISNRITGTLPSTIGNFQRINRSFLMMSMHWSY